MIPSDNPVLDTIALALLVIAVPPVNMFPVVYAFRPWRSTLIGRALMVKAIGLAVMVDVGVLGLVLGPDYAARPYVRVVAFALVVTGIWFQFIAMVRAPHMHRRDDDDPIP